MGRWILLMALAAAAASLGTAAAADAGDSVCLLKLAINSTSSPFTGNGTTSKPFSADISPSKLRAAGSVFLRVPTGGPCPPPGGLTAELLAQAALELPIDSESIMFKPNDIRSNVTKGSNKLAQFDFLGLGIGLQGNLQPLGASGVKVGSGSAADAEAAAQELCTQLLLLNGTLDLTTATLGPRTADVKHVAYNRTLRAGVSAKKAGGGVTIVTLALRGVSLLLDISPEKMPGVETTVATYILAGDIIASADASSKATWLSVPASRVAWGAVPRKDAPVVAGSKRVVGSPRYIGQNASLAQQCSVAGGGGSGSGGAAAGAGAAAKSGARAPRTAAAALGAALLGAALLLGAL